MKKRTLTRSLILNKTTIDNLQEGMLRKVKGGTLLSDYPGVITCFPDTEDTGNTTASDPIIKCPPCWACD